MAYHRRTILSEPPEMSRFREGTTKRVFTKSECASVVEIRDLSCIGVKKCKDSVRGKTYLGIPEPNGLESYVRLRRHSEQDRQTLSQEPEMRIPLSPFGVPSTNAIEVTGPPCPEYSCNVFPVLRDHEHRKHQASIGVHTSKSNLRILCEFSAIQASFPTILMSRGTPLSLSGSPRSLVSSAFRLRASTGFGRRVLGQARQTYFVLD